MIETFMSVVGGVGTSTLARGFAREKGGLLIEASNRMRMQDLLLEESPDHIYDYWDFLTGEDIENVPISGEAYDLIQGSVFHDLEEAEEDALKNALESLDYENIAVDLSRFREEDLVQWGNLSDHIYLIGDGSASSLRAMERVRYVFRLRGLQPEITFILNRIKDEKIIEWDEDLGEATLIREGQDPVRTLLQGDDNMDEKKSFWSFLKRRG